MTIQTEEIEILTFEELSRQADEFNAEQLRRNPRDSSGITLTGGGYEYFIASDRLDTPGKVLHWMHHLTEKAWITTHDLRDVMAYAWEQHGVDPYAASA